MFTEKLETRYKLQMLLIQHGIKMQNNSKEQPLIKLDKVCVDIPVIGLHSASIRRKLTSHFVGGNVDASENGITTVSALKNITFEIPEPTGVGILGHNGSGKSTLLQVLAGIYTPSKGTVYVNGEITPFFGLNEGIEPDMTGSEAIYNGCLMRGFRHREIPRIIEKVEEFAELGEFMDLPIRTYSAGMNARLLFAIATSIPPDILLIDENIGAGDQRFQEKVKERVNDYMKSARMFFLAAHNPIMLTEWCSVGILLRHGEIVFMGDIAEAIENYDAGCYRPLGGI